jgi:tRNA threonylcarbamoyladenosine biosynthesis protein TsaE
MSSVEQKVNIKKLLLQEITQSPQQTAQLAAQFATQLKPGDVALFYGDLGSGKTFFIKNICRALQSESEATSPSFTILNVYPTPANLPIYHFDFYRIKDPLELENIGLDEFLYNNGLVLIEWPEIAQPMLPTKRYEIYLDFVDSHPLWRKISIYFITDENH